MNHVMEVQALTGQFEGVELVSTYDTAEALYGKPFVTLNALLRWVAEQSEPVLLINGDLHLKTTAEQLARLSAVAADGLPYLLQTNVDADMGNPSAETWGLSAFVVSPKLADIYETSTLCMAEPWWDYWLPYVCIDRGIQLYDAGASLAYHVRHPVKAWSGSDWWACGLEFDRLVHLLTPADYSVEACERMAAIVMRSIRDHSKAVPW
jgi:hypothetical protein